MEQKALNTYNTAQKGLFYCERSTVVPDNHMMRQRWYLLWCVVAGQAGIAILLVLVLIIVGDDGYRAAFSALSGGGVAILATLCLGIRMFIVDKKASPEKMVKAFYLAEVWRIAAAVIAFTVIFLFWDSVHALWVLVAFSLGMLAHGAALLLPMESR